MPQTAQPFAENELEKLVLHAQTGDIQSFTSLYQGLYDKLYAYTYRRTQDIHASEDIVANTFYNVLKQLNTFKWKGDAQFYAWLFRITMHEIATYYRKGAKYQLAEEWLDVPSGRPSQLDQIVLDERSAALHSAVTKLPQKYKSVVELYYFAHLSHQQIAATLHIRDGASRVRLKRALEMLQTILKGDRL